MTALNLRHLLFVLCCLMAVQGGYAQISPDIAQWEEDIRKFEHLDSTESHPTNAILFAGSSSIRLWSTIDRDMSPWPVIQRGYGGAKMDDFLYYAERIIYPHHCRAVVLFVANDITGTDSDKTPAEVAMLVWNTLEVIRNKWEEVPVLFIATTPTPSRWDVWPLIREANNRIKQLEDSAAHFYFIETESAFLDEAGLPVEDLFKEDRLHLTEEGYLIWSERIKSALKNKLGP